MVQAGRSKWLLLVHDKRDSSAVPFDAIIAATPKELMKARGAGGIYDTVHSPCWPAHRSQRRVQLWFAQVATDLYAGEHEAVSLRLLLDEIAPAVSGPSGGWMSGRLRTLKSATSPLRPASPPTTPRHGYTEGVMQCLSAHKSAVAAGGVTTARRKGS